MTRPDRSLLCSVRNVFGALISMSTLVGCNSQRDYTEYNYSELVASMKTVSLTASMIGKYKDVPDSDRKTIRKNPYYLRIALLDSSSEFISAKVTSADMEGLESKVRTTLLVLPREKKFTPSSKTDGVYAGFLADSLKLNEEDYRLTLSVEICKVAGCEQENISGTLKLEIEKYQSNDAIDKFLSP